MARDWMARSWGAIAALAMLAGCQQQAGTDAAGTGEAGAKNAAAAAEVAEASAPPAPIALPAPGTPGAPPDDRTPLDESPRPPESAQGAATVVERYFGLLADRKYGEAWRLWADGGKASGMDERGFTATFDDVAEYNAEVMAPGRIEGAAGSLYVDVPVRIYGRKVDGTTLRLDGKATLRRANDVPGATAEQRRWHIARLDVARAG